MFAPDLDGKERYALNAVNESKHCAMCDVNLRDFEDMCDLRGCYGRSKPRDSAKIAVRSPPLAGPAV